MRPIRLRVKGFTAFRDEQDVDFSSLEVFAIACPTGSGKSSILDAMTYALYGYVERVGRQVGQLVSQGQPRLAATLEFAVGPSRYRVTRSTPKRAGATKVMLERCEDGEWRQFGEGADRVRECDAIVRGLIGLDYTAFTRSVLLPQGKFAEFLVGDARDRRDILTELLGLSLFKRMAERAGALAKEAGIRAQAVRDVLGREYEGVSEEAVNDARTEATRSAEREEALAKAANEVRALAERWRLEQGEIGSLRECANEARDRATSARASAAVLTDLADRLSAAERDLSLRRREHTTAERDAAKVRAARE
jgi:exonuclease SbcC